MITVSSEISDLIMAAFLKVEMCIGVKEALRSSCGTMILKERSSQFFVRVVTKTNMDLYANFMSETALLLFERWKHVLG